MQYDDHTVSDPTNCTINNKYSSVTHVHPTCSDLCAVFITMIYTKAYMYNECCQRRACTELKYKIVN